MALDYGWDFAERLTEAIGEAIDDEVAASPESFRYRGTDLRGAVSRVLWIRLANDTRVYDAYRLGREGGRAQPPHADDPIERRAIHGLLGHRAPPRASEPRRLAARLHHGVARLADPRLRRSSSAEGPAVVVLDHPKLRRFVAPVLERLTRPFVVVAAHGDPGEHEVAFQAPPSDTPLRGRALGRGLVQHRGQAVAFDAMVDLLRRHGARAVVCVEGGSPLDEIARSAGRAAGIRTLCIQQGWSPLVHPGFRDLAYDAMAVWGEGFAELLRPHSPGQRFVVTGSPALTPSVRATAGRFGDRRVVAFFLQSTSAWIAEEHLADMSALINRVASENPDAQILVREHPGAPLADAARTPLLAHRNLQFVPADAWSLRDVLDASDVAVAIYSTSLLEAAAVGVVPVVFNPTSMPHLSPDLHALGAGLEASEVADAARAVRTVLTDPAERARLAPGLTAFRDRYFADGPRDGAGETAALIDDPAA